LKPKVERLTSKARKAKEQKSLLKCLWLLSKKI
jgi:hypothetical protein